MSCYRYFGGSCKFSFRMEQQATLMNFLLSEGIEVIGSGVESGEGYVTVPHYAKARVSSLSYCSLLEERGFFADISKFFRRPGLWGGAVLSLMLFLVASLTVWRVEVNGNVSLGESEVEEALSQAGAGVGDFSPGLDLTAVAERLMSENPRIAWASVYLRGTTLMIEIREGEEEKLPAVEERLFNLVATADAIIESVYVERGRAVVSPGMTVKRGDLLVSGVYRTALGVSTVSALGEVRGRTERSFCVVQPLVVEKKEYDREEIAALSVKFFGKDINLFKKSGKTAEKYDIINRREQVVLFGCIPLPIYTIYECRELYSERQYTLAHEEAVTAAFARMRGEISASLSEDELLAISYSWDFTEEAYTLTCWVECITDITVPLLYEAESNGG